MVAIQVSEGTSLDSSPESLNWANAPTVADLKQDYVDAQSDHDTQVTKINTWLDNLNITGSARIPKVKGRSTVQPKLIRKEAEWRYAALSEPFLSADDIFSVDPVTYEDVFAAEQNALVLNNQFNTKINKVKFIDTYVRAAVNEGTAIIRVGWDFQEEIQAISTDVYTYLPVASQNEMQELQGYIQQAQKDPNTFKNVTEEHIQTAVQQTLKTGVPVFPVFQATVIEDELITVKNQPTLEICDYRNLVLDPSCKGVIEKAEFAIYSFETSLSALRKEGKYHNLDSIETGSSYDPMHTTDDQTSFTFKDKPRAKIVACEYWGSWDIDGTGVTKSIVATWVNDVMIRLEENPFPDKALPFVVVEYLPVQNDLYGESDGELLKEQQAIIGAVTRGAIDTMARSAASQRGMRKDALDPINQRKFDAGMDYQFNPNIDPNAILVEHQYPEIPNSVRLMIDWQNTDADNMTGVRAFGPTASSAGTATADRGTLDAASKRETGILRRLSKGLELVARKIIAMNAEFLSEEEVIRVTNEKFVKVRRDDLAGNFDLRLGISTAEEDDAKAKELAFMLQTMGNKMDFGMTKIILKDIARLRKMPVLKKEIEQFEPTPDPLEQQIKQLEIAKLQAEIEEIKARSQEHLTKARLNMADVNKTNSEKDKNDQDFINTQSGKTQADDLEKASAQAQANIGLEVVKAALNKDESAPK